MIIQQNFVIETTNVLEEAIKNYDQLRPPFTRKSLSKAVSIMVGIIVDCCSNRPGVASVSLNASLYYVFSCSVEIVFLCYCSCLNKCTLNSLSQNLKMHHISAKTHIDGNIIYSTRSHKTGNIFINNNRHQPSVLVIMYIHE